VPWSTRSHHKAPHGALFVSSLLLCLLALPSFASSNRQETATVRYVIDGDTCILADERTVRLIGINTPELGRDGAPDQPLAAAARDRLRALVGGKTVRLAFEAEQRDHYDRWLAHLLLPDGSHVGEQLVREGLASLVAIPPNVQAVDRLQVAEREARHHRRGLWGHAAYEPLAADQVNDAGFRLVHGKVTRTGASRKYIYLDLGARLSLRIEHQDWDRYFTGRPEAWRGRDLEARGWVTRRGDQWSIRIGHPAMLQQRPGR